MIRRWLAGSPTLSRLLRRSSGRFAKRCLDALRRLRIARSLRHVSGPTELPLSPDELVVLCVVRNGELHVRSFVEHHLRLGARWIVLVDNGSTDQTCELGSRYPEVALWKCLLPLRPFEWLLRQHLVLRFAREHWSLTLDIDERFDYPYSDRLPLRGLLSYLNHEGYTAVVTYMLDRFAKGPLGSHPCGIDDDPANVFPLYDLSHVTRHPYHDFSSVRCGNRLANPEIRWYWGGIRKQAFGTDESLTKQALVYSGRGTIAHPANHVLNASVADFTALLHHYKFLPDFRDYVSWVVDHNIFPPDSIHYRRMLQKLVENPEMDLCSATAQVYHSVDELIDAGFVIVSESLRSWADDGSVPKTLSAR